MVCYIYKEILVIKHNAYVILCGKKINLQCITVLNFFLIERKYFE